MTELEAINLMLSAIGETGVSTIDSQHPDAVNSRALLNQARREVLGTGYWFNQEDNLTISLNSDNELVLPSTCISADPHDTALNYTQRGIRMYDKTNHTYKFAGPVLVDVILDMPFEDLPATAQTYIMYSAAHALQSNFVGDERKLKNLATRWDMARRAFNADEIRNCDYNARNTPRAKKLLSGIRSALGGVA